MFLSNTSDFFCISITYDRMFLLYCNTFSIYLINNNKKINNLLVLAIVNSYIPSVEHFILAFPLKYNLEQILLIFSYNSFIDPLWLLWNSVSILSCNVWFVLSQYCILVIACKYIINKILSAEQWLLSSLKNTKSKLNIAQIAIAEI